MSVLQNFGLHTESDVAEIIKNADSRGASFNYHLGDGTSKDAFGSIGDRPEFEFDKVDEILENEPIVRAAVVSLTDKVMESDYWLEPENQKSGVDDLRERLRQTKYYNHLRQVIMNLVLYNNCYEEIVKDDNGKVEHLNTLEFAFTEPVTEKNGDLRFFKQDIPHGTSEEKITRWEPEEVVHYRLDRFNTSTVPSSNLQALWDTVLIKDYIRQWEQWFFRTNQQRPVVGVETADKKSIDAFISTLEKLEKNIRAVIPIKGEFQVEPLQNYGELSENIDQLRDWCDMQILMCLQVPPIVVGKPNESGRSDAAEQRKNLYTRVNAIQKVVQEHVNSEMLPKAGFSRVRFHWGSLDNTTEKKIFENAKIMRNANFTPEAINHYLQNEGMDFGAVDKVLMDKDDLAQMSNSDMATGDESQIGNESADEAPSRQRQREGEIQEGNE